MTRSGPLLGHKLHGRTIASFMVEDDESFIGLVTEGLHVAALHTEDAGGG
eukprot:CAMPEP_0180677388 /NCGR_PEP_ID=MMETSP1037_2-20121125/67821_1 /TAXON_ID=632150 /ORGANISM="Azadinium spinosum, Strain 3D9" /LENGTH=49 /DNA_ID= /DNA_START= /DNA_END= /DNA_ORIENTATION=